MKHEWLMNSKLWTLAWMVLFAVLLLASGVLTSACSMNRIAPRMSAPDFCGARRARDEAVGSSMLADSLSA